jgi:uncharacterized protein
MKCCKGSVVFLLAFLWLLLLSACGTTAVRNSAPAAQAVSVPAETEPETVQTSSAAYAKDAIHKAANRGDLEAVREILASGTDPDARDSYGGTALHAAMFQDNMEIVQLLIDHGYDVNAQGSSNGYTPLHDAVWAGNLAAAEILIKNGADLSIQNREGQTPAEKARTEGKTDLYEYLSNVK